MPNGLMAERPMPELPDSSSGSLSSTEQSVPTSPEASVTQHLGELQTFLHDLGVGTDSQLTKFGFQMHLFHGPDRVAPGDEQNIIYQLAQEKARAERHLQPEKYAQEAVRRFNQLQEEFRGALMHNPSAAYQELAAHLPRPAEPVLQAVEPRRTSVSSEVPAPQEKPARNLAASLTDVKNGFLSKIRGLWKRGNEAIAKLREPKAEEIQTSRERIRDRLVDAEMLGLEAVQRTQEDFAQLRYQRDEQIEQLIRGDHVRQAFAGQGGNESIDRRFAPAVEDSRQFQAWSRFRRSETLRDFARELTHQAEERPIGDLLHTLDIQLQSNRQRRHRLNQLIDEVTQLEIDRFGYRSPLGEAEETRRQLATQRSALQSEAMVLRARRVRYERQAAQLAHLQAETDDALQRLERSSHVQFEAPSVPAGREAA